MDLNDLRYVAEMEHEQYQGLHPEEEDTQGYHCPECGSPTVVRFSVLHLESQSKGLLSHKTEFAPPEKKSLFVPCVLAFILFWMMVSNNSDGTIFFVAGVVALSFAFRALVYNKNEFPAEMDQWERSFYCRQCGSVSQEGG